MSTSVDVYDHTYLNISNFIAIQGICSISTGIFVLFCSLYIMKNNIKEFYIYEIYGAPIIFTLLGLCAGYLLPIFVPILIPYLIIHYIYIGNPYKYKMKNN